MQKFKLFLFIAFAAVHNSFAQCPVAGFSLPADTLCDFTFTNTSSAGSYHWDFCSGDLKTTPNGTNLGNIGGLTNCGFVKIVNDQGNYYAFIANVSSGNVLRYDFGASLDNPAPDTLSYAGFSFPFGIDVVKDGNNWFAFVTQYGSTNLIKMELGPVISDDTTHNTILSGNAFNFPRAVKIEKDNNNYYVFVTNEMGNGINKIEFGNSLANPIMNSSVLTNPAFNQAWGFDMAYSCDSDKYIAFVANNGGNNITVVDYGNSLINPGSVLQSLTVPSSAPSDLSIVRDGNDWHLIIVNGNDQLNQLILGNNLLNPTPSTGYVGNVGTIVGPRGISMVNDSSRWHGLITNAGSNTVTMIKFEDSCSASVLISTDSIPQNIFYGTSGWQHISISVTGPNGLVNVFTDSVYTVPRPSVNFTYSAACVGQPISFTDNSTIGQGSIVSWQWNFGDGSSVNPNQNPTYLYTSLNDSTYLVTLTATSDAGCAGSFSDSISVHDLPTANFSFLNNQCSETPVQFNDLSTTSLGDSIVAWIWNFGDGSPLDNTQNPIHSFDSSGIYSVQLIAFGSSGCTDTISLNDTIKPRPVISFTVSQTCIGETTLFSNGTIISDGSALNYNWAFGDGGTSTNTNPSHPYPSTSFTYTVQLIANSTNGCADTLLQNVRISTRANPGFIMIPAAACLNNTVQFIDTSTIAAGDTIASSMWDFNDGTPVAYGDTVSHIFTVIGMHNVTLTVTSLTACDTFTAKTITVLESPTANFTFTNVCQNAPMYFYDSSFAPVGSTIDSIIWDFGDGTIPAYGDTVIHGYVGAGTYNVTLTIINNFGCSGTITQQITVYALPVAAFTNTVPACAGNAVNFTNTSTVQNDSITIFNWDFGDGNGSSVLPNPTYVYNSLQTYQVSLIVTSSHGCQATITQPVTVYTSPTFSFSDSLFCFGDATHFNYIPLQNPGSQWLWNFGDGDTAIIPNPVHPYIAAGTYNVTLTVSIPNGCSNTVSQLVTINPKPDAGILSDSVACFGTALTFTDNSTINSGAISHWIWNFGDGTPSDTTQNSNHLYGNDSTYILIHTVISVAGCIDSVSKTIEIEPQPVASFIPDPTFGSPPLPVQFLNTSSGAVTYQWTFGDGGTDIGTSPSHTYTDTGYYAVTLIATNSFLCADTAYGDISVLIPYLDLGIQQVHATKLNDLLTLSADLANLGNTAIGKFQISAKTEAGSSINEQWSSNLLVKPGKTFTYNFTARYEIDPFNIPAFYCIEISEINDRDDDVESNNRKCAAINEEFELFDIFPNPSSDDVTIGMNVPLDGSIDLSIYNSIGQLMKLDAEIPVIKGYNEFKYSVRNFANGFYAFTAKYRENVQVKRIIKK